MIRCLCICFDEKPRGYRRCNAMRCPLETIFGRGRTGSRSHGAAREPTSHHRPHITFVMTTTPTLHITDRRPHPEHGHHLVPDGPPRLPDLLHHIDIPDDPSSRQRASSLSTPHQAQEEQDDRDQAQSADDQSEPKVSRQSLM